MMNDGTGGPRLSRSFREHVAEHGSELLVARTLACLAVSRHGLSEDELLDVLSADETLMADVRARAPRRTGRAVRRLRRLDGPCSRARVARRLISRVGGPLSSR